MDEGDDDDLEGESDEELDGPKGVNRDSDDDQENQGEPNQPDTGDAQREKKKKKEEYKNYYDEMLPPDEEVDKKPPIVVVIQGPKKSGKTTLIRSLVKQYTGQRVQDVKGSITLRISKQQRITLIECPNDLSAMIDLSKIADYALLLVDASVGFEMETF